ncbi:ATP-binding protein [Pseudoalteromonas shioyasakiensis]|uniref:sensor histidine kinase n=1 Tax=Pseudoalteromonas shioyasakiensis TaxID=1190813 RepID=UPI002118B52E|nr:ATP-binding protein [Pseudoalteromonas shioyasakiensis]MCQ8878527.1 ATP-binding protein [Pseudoalteromonas shioyasakiensis]
MRTDPAISRLLMLRSGAIAIQLLAVIAVYFLFEYAIPLFELLLVISLEAVFQILSVFAYRNVSKAKEIGMLMQLTADVLFLSVLLSLSGGATNAFVSLLLLPIMIAAVSVSAKGLAYIAVLAISAYSLLLYKMPQHSMHHMDMTSHFVGMWVNFVISASVIALVIGTMNRALHSRERTIASVREKQLRNEQLVTLDGAAAQITHQLASPIANLQLLFEELHEEQPTNPLVNEMHKPLMQCATQLDSFRELSAQLRTQCNISAIALPDLAQQIQDSMLLQYPEQQLIWQNNTPVVNVKADAMLLPAILNLLQNSATANRQNKQTQLSLNWQISDAEANLLIRDYGVGFSSEQLTQLGGQIMASNSGMGLAVLLSNVTLERLNGSLTLYNHPEGGAVAKVQLAVLKDEK